MQSFNLFNHDINRVYFNLTFVVDLGGGRWCPLNIIVEGRLSLTDSQWYPLHLYLINNVKDIAVFLT